MSALLASAKAIPLPMAPAPITATLDTFESERQKLLALLFRFLSPKNIPIRFLAIDPLASSAKAILSYFNASFRHIFLHFEITSKAVIWQAVTETDLRTKNIAALQDQVRTYLNNNPDYYSDEFIARAKSVATLSMV